MRRGLDPPTSATDVAAVPDEAFAHIPEIPRLYRLETVAPGRTAHKDLEADLLRTAGFLSGDFPDSSTDVLYFAHWTCYTVTFFIT